MNQQIAEDRPDSDVSYGYTATGMPAQFDNSSGETRYAYDDRDRLVRADNPDGTSIGYGYGYDAKATARR